MNASDIVKAKQNQAMYRSFTPTIFQSTIISTIKPISSFINFVSSGIPITSTSYTSCTQTFYTYQCSRYPSYETMQTVKDAAYECAGKTLSETNWLKTQSTTMLSYQTLYSSFLNPSTILPSTVRVTSTIVQTAPTPIICPLINLEYASCPTCKWITPAGACCSQCSA